MAPQFDRPLRDLLKASGCHLGRQGKGIFSKSCRPSSIPSVFAALRRTGPFLLPLKEQEKTFVAFLGKLKSIRRP
jgi:hypothetical protein